MSARQKTEWRGDKAAVRSGWIDCNYKLPTGRDRSRCPPTDDNKLGHFLLDKQLLKMTKNKILSYFHTKGSHLYLQILGFICCSLFVVDFRLTITAARWEIVIM